MRADDRKRRKIAFFGHFDSTNFGNEATLQAILYHLRCFQPNTEAICVSTGPQATIATHQIKAIPMNSTLGKRGPHRSNLLVLLQRIFVRLPSELFYGWVRGLKALRHTDMLIIPGTGLLTDAYGLAWYGPYNMFKWSLIAKICGCKLVFVSVGAGPIHRNIGRCLVKVTLRLADFRSFRDNATKQYLKGIGFDADNDRIYPDLVFSLSEATIPRNISNERGRSVVGLGLMCPAGKYGTARPGTAHRDYLESMVSFADWLLARGYDIRLLFGDLGDWETRQAFRDLLRERLPPHDERRIIEEPILSVENLLFQIAATDMMVATRFHNVLMALLCNKPVIAISFHHKCESLMSAMGLSAYCMDINDLQADMLIEKFRGLEAGYKELKSSIGEKVGEFREALNEQYEAIFGNKGRKF